MLKPEHIDSYTPEEVADEVGVPSSPYGAEAYRILYASRAPIGTPRAVSGLIIIPTGTAPEAGFPVLAHGHGTTGMADNCAPTAMPTASARFLLEWIINGYLVSATDYVGLGTPGLHPYIVGEAEAFSMLDGARAALRFHDPARGMETPPATNRILLEGYSQGGHAALFAHQAWKSYAPELNILGTVALAPASEMRFLCQQLAGDWHVLTAPITMGMYAYSQYYGAPGSLLAWLQQPWATDVPGWIESECLLVFSARFWREDPDDVFRRGLLKAVREGRWEDIHPWTVYMDANTPGNYSSDAPVLLVHGQADDIVPPQASERLLRRLCSHGTPTKLSRYPDADHFSVNQDARPEALQWMADRLAGVPAADGCPEYLFLPLIHRRLGEMEK